MFFFCLGGADNHGRGSLQPWLDIIQQICFVLISACLLISLLFPGYCQNRFRCASECQALQLTPIYATRCPDALRLDFPF